MTRTVRQAREQAAGRSRADEGFAMSSPVALMSAAAVVLAGVAFLVTDHEVPTPEQIALASGPAPIERRVVMEAVHVKPTVDRSAVYVSVYNNSNITGLAGATAQRIVTAGWQVVATDNWYGTIPATTIYYPERLKDAAMLLSKDLGIERVMPAVDPMSMDRLTLIITSDFA
jgi:hypothetical protein